MAVYTVHGGHAKQGNKYSGAVGFCSESVVDRAICAAVIKYLKAAGHEAHDCTVDSGISQGNIITKIKKKINSYKNVTANISIHLNMNNNPGNEKADGILKGVETWIYPDDTNSYTIANRICLEIKVLGFKNRGVKTSKSLGVLKGIKNGGANILVECFFCDDQDDYNLFNKVGVDAIGKAIAMGVLGKAIPTSESYNSNKAVTYIYNGIDYAPVFDAVFYEKTYPDIKAAFKGDAKREFQHFIDYGMKEGRIGSKEFNVQVYKERYSDLKAAFGNSLWAYYQHYCMYGKKEGRKAI